MASPPPPSSPSSVNPISKRELIKLKPPSTPIRLDGDQSRGLLPATYHPVHGLLQQAPSISLKNQKVLEEDDYMEALSNIIKRDFFPCLDQFEKEKKKWLEHRRQKIKLLQQSSSSQISSFSTNKLDDLKWSENQSKSNGWEDGDPTPKIHQAATPGMTPFGTTDFADTPNSTSSATCLPNSTQSTKNPPKPYDESLSLDEFCSRYTSEDNSSFCEILNNANRLKRIKYAWAFNSSSNHNSRLLESTLKREHLIGMIGKMAEGGHGVGLIEGISGKPGERKMIENVITKEERLAIEAGDTPKLLTLGKTPQERNNSQDSRNPASSQSVTAIDLVTDRHRQSIKNPDSWPHVTRNALMFAPDANTSNHEPAKPPPFPAKPPALLGDPKSINYASTRMANDELLETNLMKSRLSSRHSNSTLSPTRSQIVGALNGNSDSTSSSPKVNGFSYVSELPTPNPENLKETSELDQLMTWGEIMSTPLRIDSNNDLLEGQEAEEEMVEAGPFKISKTPRREELAIGMARKASKSLREKYGHSSGLGTNGFRRPRSKLRQSLLGGDSSRDSFVDSNTRSPYSPSGYPSSHRHLSTPRREENLSSAGKALLKKTGSPFCKPPSSPLTTVSPYSTHKSDQLNQKAGIFSPVVPSRKRKLQDNSSKN